MNYFSSDVSVVIAGAAGQGIKTIEKILSIILKDKGLYIFSTSEYMSRVRGGINSTEIRISATEKESFVDRIDILIALDEQAILHLKNRITDNTIIFDEKTVAFSNILKMLGGKIYLNNVALGLMLSLFNVEKSFYQKQLEKQFGKKGEEVLKKNILAVEKGYEVTKSLIAANKIKTFSIIANNDFSHQTLMTGTEAIGAGAIAGGCNFACAYPMSPSTGVFTYLAQRGHTQHIKVEQVEDEIAAVNMALGAWYAGARAMTTTSGGGFALMTEGISLAGMLETPVVIMIGERPGPATGLPTRTEQGDLNLALYAGHGEFPRAIFAPGTLKEAYEVTAHAFNVADKFQVPVIILADQNFLDAYGLTDEIDPNKRMTESHIVKTDKNYKRYALTNNGISPRGIPGFGEGIVRVDSDEHTEEGLITESAEVRVAMQNKRMKKLEGMTAEALEPIFIGEKDYDYLLIDWGSNFGVLKEAIQNAALKEKVAMLHFAQVYPLHPKTKNYLEKAKKVMVIENNFEGQFARLLEREFKRPMDECILQYNGSPFSVEKLAKSILDVISM